MSFPESYTIAATSPAARVIDVVINGKETPHCHKGGQLFQRRSIIEVFSYPDHISQFKCIEEGKELEAVNLPPFGDHYSVTPKEVRAVFIEIIAPSDPNAAGCSWDTEPEKAEFKDSCWKVAIHHNKKLSMKEKEGYAVSDTALKIYQYVKGLPKKVEPIPNCHYKTYYLEKNQDYLLEGGQTFFLREI